MHRTRAQKLREWSLDNPINAEILRRLPQLDVPGAMLVAGCVYQAVWNRLSGWPSDQWIKDYDIFYFDDRDLSWDAEDRVIRRASALFADLSAAIEVRNQARVHLWYPDRFGQDYPVLTSVEDGIDRYLVPCTCIGLRADGTLYAPYGLDDLWEGVLRPNPIIDHRGLFQAKAETYRRRWPWLRIAA